MSEFVIGAIVGLWSGIILASLFWTTLGLRLMKLIAPPAKPPTLLPALFWAIGAGALFLSAVGTGIYSAYFLLSSQPATATVLEIRTDKDSDGHYSRQSVYQFHDALGVEHRDPASLSGGRMFTAGDIIPVRYLKSAPAESRIDYFEYHWLLPLAFGLFAIVAVAVSAALRWNYYRQVPQPPRTGQIAK